MLGGPSSSGQPSLADLLQQSRKLNTHLGGSRADLPSIQLGLDQIEAQSRKLAQARASTLPPSSSIGAAGNGGLSNDAKAHYFLANGGIDAGGLADTISQTNFANAFEPLQPIYDTDVDVGAPDLFILRSNVAYHRLLCRATYGIRTNKSYCQR